VGAHAPQGREKNRRNSLGKYVSAPLRRSKSQFLGHFFAVSGILELELVVLDRLLEATTEKRSSTL